MTPRVLLRLLKQHALWFILLPCITAITVFFLTQDMPKVYKSQATLYTGLASGYSLLTDNQNGYIDHSAASFENLLTTLNSQETMRQIGTSLLALHLPLEAPKLTVLSEPGFQKLRKAVPENLRLSLIKDPARLPAKIDSLLMMEGDNPIKKLITKPESDYSPGVISKKLKASRKNSSDMLDLEYESEDPAIAQKIISLAIDILNKRYIALKTTETNTVVNYYNEEFRKAKKKLDDAESRIQAFSIQYKVLDFREESKNMADSKEVISNEYNQELMKNKAAKAAVDVLSRRLGQRGTLLTVSSEMKAKQAALTEAENQLINGQAYGQPKATIDRLKARVNQISEEMKTIASKYYAATDSPDAIPQQLLINEWLTKVIEFEESAARLEVSKKQIEDYDTKTRQYSPLESQLRQLNRELGIAEKEYLAAVQSLNQATTRRQDILVDGALTVLDPPGFPATAESKRWLFVGLGGAVGIFLALLLAACRYWFDRRISSPEQAEAMIGRPVAALFPTVRKFTMDSVAGRTAFSMFEQLCSAINIELAKIGLTRSYPPVITLFSVRSKQGKTWTANGLARIYAESGQRIAYCYPRLTDDQQIVDQEGITFFPYTRRTDFMNLTELEDLFENGQKFDPSAYDKILLEIPAIITSPIPVYLLHLSTVSLLITDVNSIWARTEKQLLAMYLKSVSHPVLAVLNRVDNSYIDAPSRADARERPIQPESSVELQRSMRSLEQQRTLRYGKLT
ncbi:GumC family protein [Larkinella terrae]|uniref:Lipopolysaccharide biosynthesis protein n=1 Tax=Larkinella terrae TaxID=2025311 RepID=A0A7K0EK70_9BACT|nr:lipopolysaccharide biosynthesis protein [Larkinella terrae]MRS62207.1 lipopolysaccharide biosynthesis protein [Larkinella terrae]